MPNVPKMTKNDPSVPKDYLTLYPHRTLWRYTNAVLLLLLCINCCSELTNVPNVKCTIVHQMYQNLQEMMPSVLSTGPILSVPNATGVSNVLTVLNVCVLCFFLLMRLLERLDGFSPNLHQHTSLRCYSLIVAPHKNQSPKSFGGLETCILPTFYTLFSSLCYYGK